MKRLKYLIVLLLFTLSYAGSYTDLYPYLVDIKGWKGDKPTGSKMSGPFGTAVTAQRSYIKDSKSLEVTIFKGSMAAAMFAPFTMITEVDTPTEYVKVFNFKGFKTGLSHNKQENSGEIIVFLAPDGVFSVKYSGMGYKKALDLIGNFPLKEISKKLMEM
ncbi:hypothetical protein [Persephonella sp.]